MCFSRVHAFACRWCLLRPSRKQHKQAQAASRWCPEMTPTSFSIGRAIQWLSTLEISLGACSEPSPPNAKLTYFLTYTTIDITTKLRSLPHTAIYVTTE